MLCEKTFSASGGRRGGGNEPRCQRQVGRRHSDMVQRIVGYPRGLAIRPAGHHMQEPYKRRGGARGRHQPRSGLDLRVAAITHLLSWGIGGDQHVEPTRTCCSPFGRGQWGLRAMARGCRVGSGQSTSCQRDRPAMRDHSTRQAAAVLIVRTPATRSHQLQLPRTPTRARDIHPTQPKWRKRGSWRNKTYGAALQWAGNDAAGAQVGIRCRGSKFFHQMTASRCTGTDQGVKSDGADQSERDGDLVVRERLPPASNGPARTDRGGRTQIERAGEVRGELPAVSGPRR